MGKAYWDVHRIYIRGATLRMNSRPQVYCIGKNYLQSLKMLKYYLQNEPRGGNRKIEKYPDLTVGKYTEITISNLFSGDLSTEVIEAIDAELKNAENGRNGTNMFW